MRVFAANTATDLDEHIQNIHFSTRQHLPRDNMETIFRERDGWTYIWEHNNDIQSGQGLYIQCIYYILMQMNKQNSSYNNSDKKYYFTFDGSRRSWSTLGYA